MNVGELDYLMPGLIAQGKAEEKAEGIYLDVTPLGIQKVLGKGKVTKKMMLKANKISRIAQDKIESAGGTVEQTSGV